MKSPSQFVKSPPVHPVNNEKIEPSAERRNVLKDESYIPVSDLEHSKVYRQIFLVGEVTHNEKMRTVQGKTFARVTLKDITGEISGVIWEFKDDVLREGDYVEIELETKLYRGDLEFTAQAETIKIVPTPVNEHDYVKGVSDSMLLAYAGEVENSILSMEDPIYRDIMGNAMHRLDLLQSLREAPYGLEGSMAYRGGLLVHVAHSIRLAVVAIKQAKELEIPFNASLVIAGCALRNIGWYTTTRFQGDQIRSRDAYYMTGIQRASARYIDHLMLTCESDLQIKIPEAKRQALENMCNKQPEILTLEGKIVSCADNMADILDFGAATLQHKQIGSWAGELFVGHI